MTLMRLLPEMSKHVSIHSGRRGKRSGGLILSLLLAAAGHAQALQSGDFLYFTNAVGEATITGYAGTGGDLVIPPTLNGARVVDIANRAFCEKPLTSVQMAGNVTRIGVEAFAKCNSLTNAVLCNGVTIIEHSAFYECENLTECVLPDSLTTIGYDAFAFCAALKHVTLPGSVTSIGEGVFAYCEGLTSVIINNGVVSIGDDAFFVCTKLAGITFPKSVTAIGTDALYGCSALTSITVDPLNPVYSSENGVLYNIDKTECIEYPQGKAGWFSIPNSISAVRNGLFAYCSGLTGVTIPDSVKTIGDRAFAYCYGLADMTIPNTVTNLGEGCFWECRNLAGVSFGTGITRIRPSTFKGCHKLTSFALPATVTDIGESAFSYCGFISFTIPDSVTMLGEDIFAHCPDLERVVIGNNVTELPDRAFYFCGNLKMVEIGNSAAVIGNMAFWWCGTLQWVCFKGAAPGSVGTDVFTGADQVTVCRLTEASGWGDTFADRPTAIWDPTGLTVTFDAANGAVNLEKKEVVYNGTYGPLPSPSYVGHTFGGWWTATEGAGTQVTADTRVTIPLDHTLYAKWTTDTYMITFNAQGGNVGTSSKTVTYGQAYGELPTPTRSGYSFFGWWMDANGSGDEISEATIVSTAAAHTLYAKWVKTTFVVTFDARGGSVSPRSKSVTYKHAYGDLPTPTRSGYTFHGWWTGPNGAGSEITAASVVSVLNDHTLYAKWKVISDFTYEGTGDTTITITGYTGSGGKVVIPAELDGFTVTAINGGVFSKSLSITGVVIPGSVTSVADSAFYQCANLASVTFGNGVTHIGNSAFCFCQSLTAVHLPDSVTSVEDSAFYQCTNLASVTFGNGVTHIGNSAFCFCQSLTAVHLPDSVTSVEDSAFYQCTNLASVTFGNAVTHIGDSAFSFCQSLTAVHLPDSVTHIGDYAFRECGRLADLTLGTNLLSIGDFAFTWCVALKAVAVPDSVTSLGDRAFGACEAMTNAIVGSGVSRIGALVFSSCRSLTRVELRGDITAFGDYAFCGCSSLAEVPWHAGLTNIGEYAFSETAITHAPIPFGVSEIRPSTFQQCSRLENVVIPGSVTNIGEDAFWGCLKLQTLEVPDSVTSIGHHAFFLCTALEGVVVGNGISFIGESAFANSYKLRWVCFKGDAPLYDAAGAFYEPLMGQANTIVYYMAGATGWGETFSGRPTALWDPSGLTVTFDAAGGVCETGSTWVPVGSTYGVLPVPTRENYRFAGWWTEPDGNGRQVTDNSPVISLPDHTLYAFWSNSYLCPPGEDDTLTMAGSYDGHFYTSSTFDGKPTKAVRGTLSVKITKVTGTLTAKAVLQTGSLSFSAKTWTQIWPDGTFCAIMRTRSNETLEMYIRQNRIWGALFGGKLGPEFLSLDGARNRFDNTRDAEAQALLNTFKGYYTVSLPIYDALSASEDVGGAPQGAGYLTVTVGSRGAAKVAGILADGTTVSHASRLILFDGCGPEACVPLFVPLYLKKGWVGGLLWLNPETRTLVTDRDIGWFIRWEKPGKGPDGFSVLLDACGGFYGTGTQLAAAYLFGADVGDVPYYYTGGAADWMAFPQNVPVAVAGTRMTITKGTKPVKVTENGVTRYAYGGGNPTSATLSFTLKTGIFKGTFSLYYDYDLNGRLQHKTVSVPYAGILTPVRGEAFSDLPVGMGYCLVPDNAPAVSSYKLKRSFPVWLGTSE